MTIRSPIICVLNVSKYMKAVWLSGGFKTRSGHSLRLFLVVPGLTSQLH